MNKRFSDLQFDCSIASPKEVASCFRQSEVIVLENAFNLPALREVGDTCQHYFKILESLSDRSDLEQDYIEKGAVNAHQVGEKLFSKVDYLQKKICYLMHDQPVVPFLQEILETERPALLSQIIGIRRKDPGNFQSLLPYHQDDSIFQRIFQDRVLDQEKKTITGFVPFCDVGTHRPSIDLIARKFDRILTIDPSVGREIYRELHLDERELGENCAEYLWSPVFREGGLALFTGKIPHRSQHSNLNTKPRYSMDIRFTDGVTPPKRYHNQWIFDIVAADFVHHSDIKKTFLSFKPYPAESPIL